MTEAGFVERVGTFRQGDGGLHRAMGESATLTALVLRPCGQTAERARARRGAGATRRDSGQVVVGIDDRSAGCTEDGPNASGCRRIRETGSALPARPDGGVHRTIGPDNSRCRRNSSACSTQDSMIGSVVAGAQRRGVA